MLYLVYTNSRKSDILVVRFRAMLGFFFFLKSYSSKLSGVVYAGDLFAFGNEWSSCFIHCSVQPLHLQTRSIVFSDKLKLTLGSISLLLIPHD